MIQLKWILVVLLTLILIIPSYLMSEQFQKKSGELSETTDASLDLVWHALLLTLKQEALTVDYFSMQTTHVNTHYQIIPVPRKMRKIYTDRCLTDIKKRRHIWENMRYRLDIALEQVDSLKTKIHIKTIIEVYETRATHDWHLFSSTGKLEKDFLSKIYINLEMVQRGEAAKIPNKIDLLWPDFSSSGSIKKTYKSGFDNVWKILNNILKDNAFKSAIEDKESGIFISEFVNVSEFIQSGGIKSKILFKKDFLIKRKKSILEIMEKKYRCRIFCHVNELNEDGQGTKVIIETQFERYESNVTNKWYGIKSSGIIEKRVIENLDSALQSIGSLDLYEFPLTHLSPQMMCDFASSFSDTWIAILATLKNYSLRVKQLQIDNPLIIVTERNKVDQGYLSLKLGLENKANNLTQLSMVVSCCLDDLPKFGIQYVPPDEDYMEKFLSAFKKNLDKKKPTVSEAFDKYIDKAMDNRFISADQIDSLVNTLITLEETAVLPNFEILENGIQLKTSDEKSTFMISFYLPKPIESEVQLDEARIIKWILKNVISHFAFALKHSLHELSKIDNVLLELSFRYYNVDDQTPIDNRLKKCRISIQSSNLMELVNLETGLPNLAKVSSIMLDGKKVIIQN